VLGGGRAGKEMKGAEKGKGEQRTDRADLLIHSTPSVDPSIHPSQTHRSPTACCSASSLSSTSSTRPGQTCPRTSCATSSLPCTRPPRTKSSSLASGPSSEAASRRDSPSSTTPRRRSSLSRNTDSSGCVVPFLQRWGRHPGAPSQLTAVSFPFSISPTVRSRRSQEEGQGR